MDAVSDIKSRLPIEDLVARYCQLQKKGRNFVALCPFHKDSHPSLLVSPDKGIAYCFACQTGGDIFSFYQAIEGVDFRQAIKDLAERAGVTLEEHIAAPVVQKDEKERIRDCLTAAHEFFQKCLQESEMAMGYIQKRGISPEIQKKFELGFAPDSFSETYEHLLKNGFSRKEILGAGLGVQRELTEEKIYDRFRNRLMFPVHDHQGNLIAFGGRTLGDDDAKYINSSEGILYHKSNVLFGLHHAKDAIREAKKVVVVEGYFDVLACHRVGIENVVATSGTALTEQHAKLMKRNAETVILCLDQDRAGQDACERAFPILAKENLLVSRVSLAQKDPDEAVQAEGESLGKILADGGLPYLDFVLQEISRLDLSDQSVKREALMRVLSLLQSLTLSTEQEEYLRRAAGAFSTTETALREDLKRMKTIPHSAAIVKTESTPDAPIHFSKMEIALSLFVLYPKLCRFLSELIPPEEGMAAALYTALKKVPEGQSFDLTDSELPADYQERIGILALFAEHHAFGDWSESLAIREIRKNCVTANREVLQAKQQEIKKRLLDAHRAGRLAEEMELQTQYHELLKLSKMAIG